MKPMHQITSDEVAQSLEKATQEAYSLDWMTPGLAEIIDNTVVHAAGCQAVLMISNGLDPRAATRVANDMLFALAFNLGMGVGREMQASMDFAAMMGGALSDEPPADAGERE